MCAGDEHKLQVKLGGSLTFYKKIVYTEKANSVISCIFGQTHENMLNAAQKGVHNSDHQYRDQQKGRNQCTKISRSGMEKKLRVVRGGKRTTKEMNDFRTKQKYVSTASCQKAGQSTEKSKDLEHQIKRGQSLRGGIKRNESKIGCN